MKNGEKDGSKIKTGSGTPVLGILGGMIQCVSETGIAQSLSNLEWDGSRKCVELMVQTYQMWWKMQIQELGIFQACKRNHT